MASKIRQSLEDAVRAQEAHVARVRDMLTEIHAVASVCRTRRPDLEQQLRARKGSGGGGGGGGGGGEDPAGAAKTGGAGASAADSNSSNNNDGTTATPLTPPGHDVAPAHHDHPDGPTFYSTKTLADQLGRLRAEVHEQSGTLRRMRKLCSQEKSDRERLVSQILLAAADAAIKGPGSKTDHSESPDKRSPTRKTPAGYFSPALAPTSRPPSAVASTGHAAGPLTTSRHPLVQQGFSLAPPDVKTDDHDLQGSAKGYSQPAIQPVHLADGRAVRHVVHPLRSGLQCFRRHRRRTNRRMAAGKHRPPSTNDRSGMIAITMATDRFIQSAKESAVVDGGASASLQGGYSRRMRRKSSFLRGVVSSSSMSDVLQRDRDSGSSSAASPFSKGLRVSADWLKDDNNGRVRQRAESLPPTEERALSPPPPPVSDDGADGGAAASKDGAVAAANGAQLRVPLPYLKMIFSRIDVDGSMHVDRHEFVEGCRRDPDVRQLFDTTIGDDVNITFEDVFNSIDDDQSASIDFSEFVAFFEVHDAGVFKAGELVDAVFAEEDSWYVARVVKPIVSKGSGDDGRRKGSTRESIEGYLVRYRGYESDGAFEVPADLVRARFEPGEDCAVILENHHATAVHGSLEAVVVAQTDEGYIVRVPSQEDSVVKLFASDVFVSVSTQRGGPP